MILVGLSMICSRLYVLLVRSSSFHFSGREESFRLAKKFTLKSLSSTISASNEIEDSAI